jgi:alcohol dehydrogenase class IV
VPTTCGSGAEASAVAVYTDADSGRKIPVVARQFLADLVILDGRFLDSVDERQMAASLADACSHGIEAYLSIVPNHLAKEAAVSALRLLLDHGPAGAAPARHDRLMEAGYLAGVAASNCSVGVVHAFAHSMARWGMPHGRANAVGLVPGLRANAAAPATARLVDRLGYDSVARLEAALGKLFAPARSVDGASLDALRSPDGRETIAAAMASDVCLRSNPVPLGPPELDAFLHLVLETVAVRA